MAASEKLRIQAELETKRVQKELARIEKQAAKVGKTISGAFSGSGGSGGAKGTRALGSGLSAATVKANEFSKSLEASNARVVAFGASAGVIMGVERALKSMVASTVKVEKALMDVNVVMNAPHMGGCGCFASSRPHHSVSVVMIASHMGGCWRVVSTRPNHCVRVVMNASAALWY